MRPITTPRSNAVFSPPHGGEDWCDPVPVERTQMYVGEGRFLPVVKLTFALEPSDLALLNNGAHLVLTIIGDGMPPVALEAGIADGSPAALSVEI